VNTTLEKESKQKSRFKKTAGKVNDWVDERLDIKTFTKFIEKKYVPIHSHSIWYYFGGVSLFLFLIQVITGILLLFYYKGSEDLAYESIQFIMSKVQFGWLVRSIHTWAANLFVLAVFIHMFSVFFQKAYRKPRELTWVTGVLLLFLSLALGFSGYLLPWNQVAFFATKVGTDIVGSVPLVGETIKIFLRGGEDVTGATLSRFFGFHVALFPAMFTTLLIIHLVMVQRQGMSEPIAIAKKRSEQKKSMPFFPNFLLRDLLLWLVVLNVLAILAVFFPSELGEKADTLAPAPEGIKPEWYFMFMFQFLKYIPGKILFINGEMAGILLFSVAGLLWLLVPFWDKKSSRGLRNRTINYIGLFAVLFIIIFTILGFLS
jgi:quinol-cytochrome oxidoreductase complex cytochrome b subunit